MSLAVVDTLVELGVPGVIGGFGGVALGWWLNRGSARHLLAAQQRQTAIVELLNALAEAKVQAHVAGKREDVHGRLGDAYREWQRAWLRYSGRIDHPETVSRVQAIAYVLSLARLRGGYEGEAAAGDESRVVSTLAMVVDRAFRDAFAALDALIAGKDLPPRSFPTATEAAFLVSGQGEVDKGILHLAKELESYPQLDDARSTWLTL